MRLVESVVCRRYFNVSEPKGFHKGSEIPEEYCKSEEIQVELAWVISFITMFTNVVGMLHYSNSVQMCLY